MFVTRDRTRIWDSRRRPRRRAVQGEANLGARIDGAQFEQEGLSENASGRSELRGIGWRRSFVVGRAWRRHAQVADQGRVAAQYPVGDVRALGRESGLKRVENQRAGSNQGEILARVAQAEIRVQRRARVGAILAGGEHDQVSAGCEVGRRKTPFQWVSPIVGEEMARQVDGCPGWVVDFYPPGMFPVLVGQGGLVVGHELGDDQVVGRMNQLDLDLGVGRPETVGDCEHVSRRSGGLDIGGPEAGRRSGPSRCRCRVRSPPTERIGHSRRE